VRQRSGPLPLVFLKNYKTNITARNLFKLKASRSDGPRSPTAIKLLCGMKQVLHVCSGATPEQSRSEPSFQEDFPSGCIFLGSLHVKLIAESQLICKTSQEETKVEGGNTFRLAYSFKLKHLRSCFGPLVWIIEPAQANKM
jgi:hypothetical protein